MKIKDMNSDQLREYNRIQKQNQRERERQEAAAKRIPNANDFRMPIAKQAELDKHANDILKAIQAELPDHRFAIQDEFVIETVACALFGLENNISQKVQNPDGMLVGGRFPDASRKYGCRAYPSISESSWLGDIQEFVRQVLTGRDVVGWKVSTRLLQSRTYPRCQDANFWNLHSETEIHPRRTSPSRTRSFSRAGW